MAKEDGEPVYSFYGDHTADSLLLVEELPDAFFDETRVLHFGGISLLRGTTPAAVLAAVERLKGKALLSFDPNIRPGLVEDEAGYRMLLQRLFALADIVKISAADIGWLAPGQSPEQFAAELLARGPAMVALTRGGEGALLLRPDGRWAVPPFRVEVVDTVGAGDSFSAGLLAALAERGVTSRDALLALSAGELEATLEFATAVSALTCSRAGANPPRRAEVQQFLVAAGTS